MNATEIKARLYEIEQRIAVITPEILKAAAAIREAAMAEASVTAPQFAALNAGLMIDRVRLIAEAAGELRDELKRLADEKRALSETLKHIGG
jgi:hypothetical protein